MRALKDKDMQMCLVMGALVIAITWGLDWLVWLFFHDSKPTTFNIGLIVPGMALWGFYSNKEEPQRSNIDHLLVSAIKTFIVCVFLSICLAITPLRLFGFGLTMTMTLYSLVPIGRLVKATKENEVKSA